MNTEIGPREAATAKGETKRRYVVRLFDAMAPRYDLITWIISLGRVVPILAAPLGGRESFEYLSESILKHVSPAEMAEKLEKLGCRDVELKNYSLGSATRVMAVKDL
jgi:ubiquinone/menaquinone biosynthesis C-methylase UbiE